MAHTYLLYQKASRKKHQCEHSCHFIKTRIFNTKLLHANAKCVNRFYHWVCRVSFKMFHLDYKRQSKVPNLSFWCYKRSIMPINSKQEKLSKLLKAANLPIIFLSAKLLHTNVNCDHSVKTNVPYYSIKKLINMQI